jgi:hypothetical protein
MTPQERHQKLISLTKQKRAIESRAKRRGNEFYFTFDEKAEIRSLNGKIDRLIESQEVKQLTAL